MGVVKRSISFDAAVWAELERSAGDGPVSPLVNEAVARFLKLEAGRRAVAEYEREFGAFTPEELAEAKRVLDDAGVTDYRRRPAAQPKTAAAKTRGRRRSA